MIRRTLTVSGLAAALVHSAVGCTAPTPSEERAPLADAAAIAPSIELWPREPGSFDAVARREGVSVRLELRRGALRPREWAGDPASDGRYEGDVLLADAQGRPVLVELGGHSALDPTWPPRIERVQGAIDPAVRRRELELGAEVAAALAGDPRLDFEAQLLAAGLARSARATLDGFEDGPDVIAGAEPSAPRAGEGVDAGARPEPRGGAVGEVRQALQTAYVHQVYIRGANCCWPGYHHSSTRLRIFDDRGVLVADLKTRNHGRWVDDPSMRTAVGCPKAWSGRTHQTPLYVPYFASDTFAAGKGGGCQTAYGIFSGQHVCNDDSFAQYSNVKNDPLLLPSYATCSDSSLRGTAPTCF